MVKTCLQSFVLRFMPKETINFCRFLAKFSQNMFPKKNLLANNQRKWIPTKVDTEYNQSNPSPPLLPYFAFRKEISCLLLVHTASLQSPLYDIETTLSWRAFKVLVMAVLQIRFTVNKVFRVRHLFTIGDFWHLKLESGW